MKEEETKNLHEQNESQDDIKIFALMLFFSEFELGISQNPNKWVHTRTIRYPNGFEALEAYANTRCPASQLIRATSEEDLQAQEEEMRKNFQDQQWLETVLYPCL